METVILLFAFFTLGMVAMYFLHVAKNVAYVIFVMVLGWGTWQYIGPNVLRETGTGTAYDTLLVLNDSFVSRSQNGVRMIMYDDRMDLGESLLRSVQDHGFLERKSTGTTHASAPDEPLLRRVLELLRDALIELL